MDCSEFLVLPICMMFILVYLSIGIIISFQIKLKLICNLLSNKFSLSVQEKTKSSQPFVQENNCLFKKIILQVMTCSPLEGSFYIKAHLTIYPLHLMKDGDALAY